jgi:formate hydrogenlyase transcriptional activator
MSQTHQDLRQALEERLRFETLMADLSAQFVNLPADQVDSAIEEAQRRLCEGLGLDRSALWQKSVAAPEMFLLTHLHQPDGRLPARKPAEAGSTPRGEWQMHLRDSSPSFMRVEAKAFFPWVLLRLQRGEIVVIPKVDDLPAEASHDKEMFRQVGTVSTVVVPLAIAGRWLGALSFASLQEGRRWSEAFVKRFSSIANLFSQALDRQRADLVLREAQLEVKRLQQKLQEENVYLRSRVKALHGHAGIIGQSEALRRALAQAEKVAPTGSTVLLLGETGVGKELIASAIHELSPRRSRAMVTINCAAIPATLLESELFGREKGAYTGAHARQIGSFELASGSTIFLDEVAELPVEMQAKLLRVLEEMKLERLGSPQSIPVDLRVIAATNQDLEARVREGKFRTDLFYRLNVFPIRVPPLRERREDIPPLVHAFADEFARVMGKEVNSVSKSSLEALERYSWPGNVRELRNAVERAVILAAGPKLKVEIPGAMVFGTARSLTMEDTEREHIRNVLEMTGWRVRGKGGAATVLDLNPSTLRSRMTKLGIRRPAP